MCPPLLYFPKLRFVYAPRPISKLPHSSRANVMFPNISIYVVKMLLGETALLLYEEGVQPWYAQEVL